MVTGPDLSSQHEVSVSMEMDQLSSNLLLFMHGQGGEGQKRIEEREGGGWVCDRHLSSNLHIKTFTTPRSADQT